MRPRSASREGDVAGSHVHTLQSVTNWSMQWFEVLSRGFSICIGVGTSISRRRSAGSAARYSVTVDAGMGQVYHEGFCRGKLSLSLARRSLGEGGWFPLCLPFPPTSDIRLLTSTMFAPQFILWHAVASQRRHRQNRTHPRFWILPAADERRFVICLPSSVSTSYFRFSFVPRHSSPTRRAQFSTRGSFINTTSLEL